MGAKVKRLLVSRLDAEIRILVQPVSVLYGDFDEKLAGLPHDEARSLGAFASITTPSPGTAMPTLAISPGVFKQPPSAVVAAS